jgi:hypothetical protein
MFIRIRNDKYGHREVIPSDDEFGRGKLDRHFQNRDAAEAYFDRWTANLMSEVQEKGKVLLKYCRKSKAGILNKNPIKIRESIRNRNKDYHRLTAQTKKS